MDAAVFDFDGVIARSMEQHAEAYRRLLAPFGVEVRDADIFAREGARSESIIRDLLRDADPRVPEAEIAGLGDRKQAIFRELGTPTVYAGAVEAVAAVQAVAPTGLVTGTRRENLERIIPDLLPRFRAVLAQSDYTHDKPHPEPYARAAAALGVDPARCIAVENAVRGVQSARAAGYGSVLAITTTMDPGSLQGAGADEVVADHGAMRDALLDRLAG